VLIEADKDEILSCVFLALTLRFSLERAPFKYPLPSKDLLWHLDDQLSRYFKRLGPIRRFRLPTPLPRLT
jgi:hypothetical protein